MLNLVFLASATYAVGVGGPCVCGQTCSMSGGGIGVCQTSGDCAVNILPPNCNNGPVAAFGGPTALAAPPRRCICGQKCTMSGGGTGVCQTNGDCAVNIVAPNCNYYNPIPRPCICGQSCTMSGGGTGVCQTNGDCAVNILPPNCNVASLSAAAFTSRLPRPCICGQTCTMSGGGTGVCQTNGDCAVNIVAPNCNGGPVAVFSGAASLTSRLAIGGPCVCGQSCTMSGGGTGVCQTNGDCAVNVLPPNCNNDPVSAFGGPSAFASPWKCPMYKIKCPELSCPTFMQETPMDERGCPRGCPSCRSTLTAAASVDFSGAALNLPDLGFVANVCPKLSCVEPNCPQVLQEQTTLSNGCRGCPRCRSLTIGGQLGGGVQLGGAPDKVSPLNVCALILCSPGYKCVDGGCQPMNPGPCANIRCRSGTSCVNGQCLPNSLSAAPSSANCALILCAPGSQCVNGACVPY